MPRWLSIVGRLISGNRQSTTVSWTYKKSAPDDCFVSEKKEHHFWKTEKGKPPTHGAQCMCKKCRY